MSRNILVSLYDPELGTIKAQVTVTNIDSLDCYLREGWAIAEGHHDPETHFIKPDTGRPNKHKSDATRPRVPIARQWASVRNQRTRLLDENRWTVLPDSPLSAECQAEWLTYLKALQAITRDAEAPADVVWPTMPELRFAEADDGS